MHRRTESNVSRIGLLTSELGYEHETFIDRLPTDNIAYSIRSPDEAVRLGLEFVTKMLEEVRNIVCQKKYRRFSLTSHGSFAGVVSGLATALTHSLGITSAVATGAAATVLIVVAQAAHKSFCEMTDQEVATVLREQTVGVGVQVPSTAKRSTARTPRNAAARKSPTS